MVPALYGESSPYVEPTPHSEGHSVTYLITPKLNLDSRHDACPHRDCNRLFFLVAVLDGGTLACWHLQADTTTDYEARPQMWTSSAIP